MQRRQMLALTVLVALLAAAATPADAEQPRTQESGEGAGRHEGRPSGLETFHARLRSFRAGTGKRLTIVQIGDSHTAADQFTARLRTRFQAEFGDGGRGMLAPGVPESYWRPAGVRATQKGVWRVQSMGRNDEAYGAFGLSGYIVRGANAGDTMELTVTDSEASFAVASIGFLTREKGGHVEVLIDGIPHATLATDAKGPTYRRVEVAAASGKGKQLTLKLVGDAPVDLADWGLHSDQRGVELIAHGFVGAQVKILDRWSADITANQLKLLDPALIILAFGTNEGYAPASHLTDYADLLRARVLALQRMAPNASIVILAGPDANRIPSYCPGTAALRDRAPCVPLTPAEAADYDTRLARKDAELCRWHTPASYAIVRGAQRHVANTLGLLLWDWMGYQGGVCAASAWHAKDWVHNDRVHLKREGANRSADAFYDELLRGLRTHGGSR